jgi:N-acetyl-anhydromuramyl-L-alanine amidase AmpD
MPYPFVEARNYTKGRDAPIEVLVLHAMEAPEKPDTAEAVARWFAGPDAPLASCHYCIDSDSIVQCVRDGDVAWHAPGANRNGLGLEHAGYSAQSGTDWDDPYSRAMLWRSARLVASKCREYDIPAEWLEPTDLLAGRRGITTHANVTLAFRRSDHTDPGPSFPAERYLSSVHRLLAAGAGRSAVEPEY